MRVEYFARKLLMNGVVQTLVSGQKMHSTRQSWRTTRTRSSGVQNTGCWHPEAQMMPSFDGSLVGDRSTMQAYFRLSLAYCSSVRLKNSPPLPIEIPCSSISRASWSMNPPARSTSSTTLADDAKCSLRGRGVWRSASRNWHCQPCLS